MHTISKELVDIPCEVGVFVKRAGSDLSYFVYKRVKYFRDKKGHPTSQSKCIGKVDESTGKMHPNMNYYTMYDAPLPTADKEEFAFTYIVIKIANCLGLFKSLISAFGEKIATLILAIAAYIISSDSIMLGIEEWIEKVYFSELKIKLTSQSTSRIFDDITDEDTEKFLKNWVTTTLKKKETVFYDVTSFSSYAKKMIEIEYGYNRDGDDLPQYNLGMFCTAENRMPLYYERYNGSLTDRTNFSYMMDNARNVGIKDIKLVLDGGFFIENCFKTFFNQKLDVTIGMSSHRKEIDTIKKQCLDIGRDPKYKVPHHNVYSMSTEKKIYDLDGKIVCYYDPMKAAELEIERYELIERLTLELSEIKKYDVEKLKKFFTYFTITPNKNNLGFTYEVNNEAVKKLKENDGYFYIFSTEKDTTSKEILERYRSKDIIEKLFSQIKLGMNGRRTRTHTTSTSDGKIFAVFIASIIRTEMLNKLRLYMRGTTATFDQIVAQLSDIKIRKDGNKLRLIKALTHKQKNILKALESLEDVIIATK